MAKIRKRTLPSGHAVWQCDYRDGKGARRSRQFEKKRDADAYLIQVGHELSRGLHVAPGDSPTVAEAGRLWVERAERDKLVTSTVRQYRQHLKHHIEPAIGTMKLAELTAPKVNEFVDGMLRSLTRATARKVLTSLGSLVDEAIRRGLHSHNPVRAVKIRAAAAEQREIEMPTRDELRAIINAAAGRWRPLVITAVFTGMRGSELRALKWSHVDLDANVIRVRERVDHWNAFGPPKSKAGKRDIPMAPMLANILREWKLACPKGDDNEMDLVFPSPSGGVLSHACILKDGFWPLQVAAGISKTVEGKFDKDGNPILQAKYSLHALRHAAAALWIEQGFNLKRLQTLMGHANVRLTMDVYGYLMADEDGDAAAMAQVQARLLG